ncbi:hypothetical protein [Enterovirga rhinocerotis]|uniref:Uncharacterized protein n=1 Tax=Enterovirga rhinocerotis TaxID=1339210 RepID=A0A4R7C7L8_9HYPH|nr:hypothetical protein [Enterovirga rhinocerotis]TDR94163.1 hypothetical protein EV668_1440 [Enterovirga rhinocerotis]
MARDLSAHERELARHALGLPHADKRSWRNHYVVGSGPDHEAWLGLLRDGLACRRPGSPLTGGDDLFWLTQVGAEGALDPGEMLAIKDFPSSDFSRRPRKTAS